MRRIVIGLAWLLPASALAGSHLFTAEFSDLPGRAQLISSGANWRCDGAGCTSAGAMSDTPARLCERLAREQGRVARFSVDGAAISDEALAKCNARARDSAVPQVGRR
ncbi:MAG: hypothetical protein RQ833_01800 [Sphingomonadaceae bacterium]|nr:hypothetical protein [Sphingomonadaceae bacterium]